MKNKNKNKTMSTYWNLVDCALDIYSKNPMPESEKQKTATIQNIIDKCNRIELQKCCMTLIEDTDLIIIRPLTVWEKIKRLFK